MQRLICWIIGHVQKYEAIKIGDKEAWRGSCARCGGAMLTFEPPPPELPKKPVRI